MNEILSKVQKDLSKLQKTIEREGEVLIGKIVTAANKATTNKSVVQKRKELETLFEKQIERFEPAFEKFYTELKSTAGKYGVNLDKIEKKVRARTTRTAKTGTTGGRSKKSTTKSTASSAVGGAKKAKKKTKKETT